MRQLEFRGIKTILKKHKMKILKTLMILLCFGIISCAFTSNNEKDNDDKEKSKHLNIYAENQKGGYLLIKTNTLGKAYLKMKGSNYSNHYFGTLIKKNDTIKFVPESALSLHKCKSGKYGENVLGIAFGNDEKALNFLKDFSVSYKTSSINETQVIKINDFQNYIELSKEENVSIILKSDENEFLKSESIEFDPKTTMLCVDSRNRSSEFLFIVSKDKVEVTNYFGRPINYKPKKSPY